MKRTTDPGYVNRNNQKVIKNTGLPGTDHRQYVYELECLDCRRHHGANGTDIHQRRCPYCDPRSMGEDLLGRGHSPI